MWLVHLTYLIGHSWDEHALPPNSILPGEIRGGRRELMDVFHMHAIHCHSQGRSSFKVVIAPIYNYNHFPWPYNENIRFLFHDLKTESRNNNIDILSQCQLLVSSRKANVKMAVNCTRQHWNSTHWASHCFDRVSLKNRLWKNKLLSTE